MINWQILNNIIFQCYYDPLYKLTKATGRELTNLWSGTSPSDPDFANSIACPNPDMNAMQNYTQEITYDEIGNITEMKNTGDWTRNYIYDVDNANNYLEGHNVSGEYDYDKHGNCIKMPHLATIDWDYRDRLKEADLGGGGTAYYTYDAGGERISKVVDNGSGLIKKTIYLGGYEVYREIISGTVDKERETVHLNDDKRRVVLVQTLTIDAGVPVGSPTEVIKYQLDNHLGSACLELDTSANIISYEEYHPFGGTSYRSGSSSAEVSLKKYKYVGKERDDETGLYYYGARYYAAWVGRWISTDPLGMIDGPNLYAYVLNNPVKLNDPEGTQVDQKDQAQNTDYTWQKIIQNQQDRSESNGEKSEQPGPWKEGYVLPKETGTIKLVFLDSSKYSPEFQKEIQAEVIKIFENFGIDINAPIVDPNSIDSSQMGTNESFAVFGSLSDVKAFIKEQVSAEVYKADFENWQNSPLHPEQSENLGISGKGHAIGINTDVLAKTSRDLDTTILGTSSFLVAHGAGHTAGLTHSTAINGPLKFSFSQVTGALMQKGDQTYGFISGDLTPASSGRGYNVKQNDLLKTLSDFKKPELNTAIIPYLKTKFSRP